MKKVRIIEGKSCIHQPGLYVGGNYCIRVCPLFVKKSKTKVYCDGNMYKMEVDLKGYIHKIIK